MPYWTYDADTASRYPGRARDLLLHHPDRDAERQAPRRCRNATSAGPRRAGRVARFFDDVLVLASASLPKRFTDALQPWDLAALAPYRPDFLAGFRAEGYTVALEDGYGEARADIDRVIERDVQGRHRRRRPAGPQLSTPMSAT